MVEDFENVSLETWGAKFALTRHDIVNDDLNVLQGIPAALGSAVPRHIGDSVYNIFRDNPNCKDGKSLFHTDHKNIVSGFGGPPTFDSVAKAITTMASQKDQQGRTLNIKPVYFIAPLSMQPAAETFFSNQYIGTQALPTTENYFRSYFKRYYDVRLDEIDPNTWYLVGQRQLGVVLVYLRGWKVPYLVTTTDNDHDCISFQIRFDYGVKPLSYRNFVKVSA
jgi:phage major head subunit gpT-like protein